MAEGKYQGPAVQIGTIQVPKSMQDGDKFIKWDEDSGVGTPVTLRVDSRGFYLYWIDQNKEMDLLDIATIRDVRTGRYAKIPKEPKLKHIVTMGFQDTLEEKTVTVCCGSDFVNLTFINFCCTKKDIAQLWTDELMKMAYNLGNLNNSTIMFLNKAHTKLTLMLDKTGKIPVKNIVKLFTQSKEDRKRVEKALEISGLPSGKNDTVSLQKFTFEDFFNFYKNLTQRTEIEKIFEEVCGYSKRKLMTSAKFVDFLNKTQRDPRLNEILYPYANNARARDLIHEYEPNKSNAQRGQLSLDGFLHYLMSEDNPIIAASKFDLSDDMDQPLSHYFINSSHNTYLTGHQITGRSSVEIYRQCLLAGCRCVELDFWNGRTEEPVIVHGYTFVPEIPARDVIEAIAETAFKTSEYPVVLSFENHCNPRQQAKIAQYCREIFGDMLLDSPLESHKLEPGVLLPPPSLLKRKIIIKNKKKHHHHHHHSTSRPSLQPETSEAKAVSEATPEQPQGNGDLTHPPTQPPLLTQRQASKDSGQEDDDNEDENVSSSVEDEEETPGDEKRLQDVAQSDKVSKETETEAGAEISALVNYVQPVHFISFENSEKKNRFNEMSSFDEKQATTLLKEHPIEFVNYNKHQLSRVYPAGTRFDSSNFMPQLFWNAGCQLVALNYQTLDLAMQLNLGIFEYNYRCGYLLKPEFMRRKDRRLDPFAESTVDGIIAGTVSVHVISGQFLSDKRIGTCVEVDMYGLPADTVRKKFRTKIVPNNGINPSYDEEPFVFKKVVLPELACIRLAAYDDSGRLIGHRVLPVVGLCPGYRHVALRTEGGQSLPLATLFLHIVVKDYVPDGLSDFAEALANPIKYQTELEKREQQLAALIDETAIKEEQDCPTINLKSAIASRRPTMHSPGSSIDIHSGTSGASAAAVNHGKSTSPTPEITSSVNPAGTNLSSGETVPSVDSTAEQLSPNQPVVATDGGSPLSTLPIDGGTLVAESLEKLMETKVVKEKRIELEKKLESLRKKHDKERARVQQAWLRGASDTSDRTRSKFYMSHKLVKRLSSKNILSVSSEMSVPLSEVGSAITTTTDGSEAEGDSNKGGLPRSQSERLLAVCKDHVNQERQLQEKYHDQVYSTVEKLMRTSQSNQLKLLRALMERETADVMRRLQAMRRDEVKQLSKIHKDKDEMVRIKREVDSSMVEKGVYERVRLTQLYDRRREELERQHDLVKQKLEEERNKAKADLSREYEGRYAQVEETLKPSNSESQP